jgi:uncharacterized BrkB/YihY/UPF0761 family membrane protein
VRVNYDVYMNAVARFEIGQAAGCKDFDSGSFKSVSNWGSFSRRVNSGLVWVIFSLCCFVILLALVLVAALLSNFVAKEEHTKIKLAKWYVYSSFVLALFALLTCLWYFLYINVHMANLSLVL